MAEQSGNDNYIKRTHCKCKYINDDEHIKTDFGYNILNERYKTCANCRVKQRAYVEANRERINENKRRTDKQRIEQLQGQADDKNMCCGRCRKLKPLESFMVNKFQCKTCDVCRKRDEHRVWSDEWKQHNT